MTCTICSRGACNQALENGEMMKPRERVEIALNHEQADRCPMQVSFTPEFRGSFV